MERPSSFSRLARWCWAHRWRTLLAWVAALVVILFVASGVGSKPVSNFRLPGTESQRAYDLLARSFPAQKGDTDQLVFHARSGTLRSAPARPRIRRTLSRVARDRDVAGVSPLRLSRDGTIGVAEVDYRTSVDNLDTSDLQRVQDTAFLARGPGLEVEQGGQGAETIRQGAASTSEGIGVLAAAFVLLVTFGSAVAAGLPLLSALLALGSTLGLITLLSHLVDTPDFASQLSALIGLGVGIDYALLVLTRYRTEVRAGRDRPEAAERALDTAGRTVFFAGCTVIIALLGLLLLGLNFLQGVAIGASLAVLLTMTAALTLLPALLSIAGRRIDRLRLPGFRRGEPGQPSERWASWAKLVQRRPVPAVLVALVILLGLAAPALGLRLGSSDAGLDPTGTTTRNAYELIARGFGPGVNGPFLMVADLPRRGDAAPARALAVAVRRDPGVVGVTAPTLSPDGRVATVQAFPRTGPQAQTTTDLLHRLRERRVPPVERATGARVEIGGLTAAQEDFTSVVAGKLPLFVGVVILLSALLLMVVFRSVVLPLKAAAMNLLSIGAALGVVCAIFQKGVLAGVLGVGTGPIESFLPVLLFAIVFGLSMDYEVFLLSRVHEAWRESDDASGAVSTALAATGRVITAAASIMVVVFASFAVTDDRLAKMFGIGFASAVLLDALVIRCLLVPAILELLGRRTWWLPGWLDRRLPQIAIEREELAGSRMPVPDRLGVGDEDVLQPEALLNRQRLEQNPVGALDRTANGEQDPA